MPSLQYDEKSASKLRFQCLPEPVVAGCQVRSCQTSQHTPATLADRSPITTYVSWTQPRTDDNQRLTVSKYLAATAREKLRQEASRNDHQLSRLVGHASLLDILVPEIEREELAQEIDRVQEESRSVFLHIRETVVAKRRRKDRIDSIIEDLNWAYDEDDNSDEEVYGESDEEMSDDRSSSSEESEPLDPVDELCAAIESVEASVDDFHSVAATVEPIGRKDQLARGYNLSWTTSRGPLITSDLKSKQVEVTVSAITVTAEL